jgi:hypothetical protein
MMNPLCTIIKMFLKKEEKKVKSRKRNVYRQHFGFSPHGPLGKTGAENDPEV